MTDGDNLPMFPVDDVTLAAVEHGMKGSYEVDEDGTHTLIGADYSLWQLLDFMAGATGNDPNGYCVQESYPEIWIDTRVHYTPNDIIKSLIKEVRRLRSE